MAKASQSNRGGAVDNSVNIIRQMMAGPPSLHSAKNLYFLTINLSHLLPTFTTINDSVFLFPDSKHPNVVSHIGTIGSFFSLPPAVAASGYQDILE